MGKNSKDLDDIKKLISELSDYEAQTPTKRDLENFGAFEREISWLCGATGKLHPEIKMPRIAIFAAHHGFTLNRPEGDAFKKTHEIAIDRILGNTHTVCNIAQSLNTDLRLYEMDLENPANDTAQGPAMTEDECVMAFTYGMMAVEEQNDFLLLSTIGAGSEDAGDRILALLKQDPGADPFEVLINIGGYEIAALCGVLIATYLGKKPVMVDSQAGLASLVLMHRAHERLSTHAAFIGNGAPEGIVSFKNEGNIGEICAGAAFKLAHLKVLLGLMQPNHVDASYQQ